MDATAGWEATRRLREWERQRLSLGPGLRLLDVGCGPDDAALALAADLGTDGEVVGVDASDEMVSGARSRAQTARSRVRFVVGDALVLDEPDDGFDVLRSERMLQWLSSPRGAVARDGCQDRAEPSDWTGRGVLNSLVVEVPIAAFGATRCVR